MENERNETGRGTPSTAPQAGAAGGPSRPLGELLDALTVAARPPHDPDILVTGITERADQVRPGHLFVALPGTSADGHAFIGDAARRGAAAIVVERDVGGAPDAPLVRVADARRALAELAAAWHGRPADGLALVGITGTAGKTSVLSLLEAILLGANVPVGTIGSLGLRIQGRARDETVYTTPDPLVLHAELARIARAGPRLVAMEVTSHALVQERVHGLRYQLGIFTNLLPLEHSEYHADFADYIRAKSLFFAALEPDAPLVYNHDDPVTRALVADRPLRGVAVGSSAETGIRIRNPVTTPDGTSLLLDVASPLPRTDGSTTDPVQVPLQLQLLGPANVMNAALAASAALCLGVPIDAVARALAAFAPPRRRLQLVHRGRFTLLDDTVGHPESFSAFFQVVAELGHPAVHLVVAVRGQRGEPINRENAETLGIWARRLGVRTLVITRSADVADPLNQVDDPEYHAFLEPLRKHGVRLLEVAALEQAVRTVLERAADGDLVALLGAQGMDRGQEFALAWLRERGEIRTGEGPANPTVNSGTASPR
jgi:UDP-N-acetylmuramoyl-L-alanyl-D-glutamate--2,6-diaminopimelate ligase